MSLKLEVREKLMKLIKEAQLTYNKKLPSENEMASLLNVSRITIRSVLGDLEREGVVRRQQGSGTYVNEDFINLKANLNPMDSYQLMIEEMGYDLEIKTYGAQIIDSPSFLLSSGYYDSEKTISSERWYYADKKLCVICIDYLPIEYEKDLEKLKDYKGSIFQYLYDFYNIELSNGIVELHARSISEIASISRAYKNDSKIEESYLLLKGVEFDKQQKPVLFTQEYVNTDMITLSLVRKRNIAYKK